MPHGFVLLELTYHSARYLITTLEITIIAGGLFSVQFALQYAPNSDRDGLDGPKSFVLGIVFCFVPYKMARLERGSDIGTLHADVVDHR